MVMSWTLRWHWAVSMKGIGERLESRDQFAWLWGEWNGLFPQVEASCVMPDHLHASEATTDVGARLTQVKHLLHRFERRFGTAGKVRWHVPDLPTPTRDREKWLRDIRYIHLNPCRAGLVRDPLEWPWSTHREWLDLGLNRWPGIEGGKKLLPWSRGDQARKFHRYVSADESTALLRGTPFPEVNGGLTGEWALERLSIPRKISSVSMEQFLRAWIAIERIGDWKTVLDQGVERRRLLVDVLAVGDFRSREIADALHVSPSYVARFARWLKMEGRGLAARHQRMRAILPLFAADPRLKS